MILGKQVLVDILSRLVRVAILTSCLLFSEYTYLDRNNLVYFKLKYSPYIRHT